jgi:hypothetical protein
MTSTVHSATFDCQHHWLAMSLTNVDGGIMICRQMNLLSALRQ